MGRIVEGDIVLYEGSKWIFKKLRDNENYCDLYYRNKEEHYVQLSKVSLINLELVHFKDDLFYKEKGVNEVYEDVLRFHFKKIDLPFHIEWSESFGFKVITNEYSFQVKYFKEVSRLFDSFKVSQFYAQELPEVIKNELCY